jgi:hypothetical protein
MLVEIFECVECSRRVLRIADVEDASRLGAITKSAEFHATACVTIFAVQH